jgi:hypothetical protein
MQLTLPGRRGAVLLAALLACAAFMTFVSADAHAQATRTWVSGVGDDANPCSRTAPCKTLAGSISKTASGGEINALDPGGFGGVTITKPITIDMTAVGSGGVLVAGTNAVVVNAGVNDSVVLRGLDIFGASTTCTTGNVAGVSVLQAGNVRIEKSTITGFPHGVRVTNAGADTAVSLDDVDVRHNCTSGVNAEPGAGRTANVAVDGTSITNSGTAVRAADGAHVWLTRSTIFDNTIGLQTVGSGVIDSFSDTRVFGNAANGTPTNDLGPGGVGPQGPAGPQGDPGPQGLPGLNGAAGQPAVKLLLAIPLTKVTAKRGKTVKLGYLTTAGAKSTLEVRKGKKVVATVKGAAKEGRNTIKWNGKVGRKAAAAGNYTLVLSASSDDGQKATSSAKLTLKR